MPPTPSRRMAAVQSPIIAVIGQLIRETPGTISLGQGVVSYGPPEAALDAARSYGTAPDEHKYGPVQGNPLLLSRIARKLEDENGVGLAGRRVVVTAGANMGFLEALFAITDPGDEVILPLPYYFNQEMAIRMLNCMPVFAPTDERFHLRPEAIGQAITERTRAVVTISPNNPSGSVFPESSLREVNRLCRERGIYHISDEAYEYFTHTKVPHFSPAAIPGSEGHTISLYSLSKAFGFAAWRIGYLVMPESLYAGIMKAQDTNLICAPGISQAAAAAALEVGVEYCRGHLDPLRRVRGIVLKDLEEAEDFCHIAPAEGAFYVLMRVETDLDALVVAERLIREHGVAVIPGQAFGLETGCYLRISYGALEPATAEAGVRRLTAGLRAIVGR